MSKKKKKNKQKVVYYDDGSTISDMSAVGRFNEKNPQRRNNAPKSASTAKEKFKTFISAVKLMVLPMLVVLAILCVLFLGLWGIGQCAAS